jgi:hypothetical protein
MPGNPIECHLNSARCLALAERVRRPEVRQTFIALAETWKRLAVELECDQPLLRTMSELEFRRPSQPCEPYEALPSALNLRSWAA